MSFRRQQARLFDVPRRKSLILRRRPPPHKAGVFTQDSARRAVNRGPQASPRGSMRQNGRFGPWIPVLLYAGLIFFLSSRQDDTLSFLPQGADKALHFIEYLPFGALVLRAFIKNKIFKPQASSFWAMLLFVALYAVSDEFHQIFVSGRTFSGLDMLSDLGGASLGGIIYSARESCRCLGA